MRGSHPEAVAERGVVVPQLQPLPPPQRLQNRQQSQPLKRAAGGLADDQHVSRDNPPASKKFYYVDEGESKRNAEIDVSGRRFREPPMNKFKLHDELFLQVRTMKRNVSNEEIMDAVAAGRRPPISEFLTGVIFREYDLDGVKKEFSVNVPIPAMSSARDAIDHIIGPQACAQCGFVKRCRVVQQQLQQQLQ